MSAPYTMQALQELADDGVHLLEIDDAGLVATVQELDALRARVAELERAQDAAFRDAHRAEADAARLREALRGLLDHGCLCAVNDREEPCQQCAAARAALASAPSVEPEGPDYSGLCSAPECGGHCGYVHARGCEAIREYLADHGGDPYKAPPRAEPTPRDMRVAYHAWNHGFTKGREYEALDTLEAMQRVGEFTLGEGIDLAAVVAKAVGT